MRDLLHKVVAQPIAEKILKEGVKLGGERREVTILFADIRHFTHMVEGMQPEEVLEMLNSCFTVLARVVDEHGGIIDKFVGDEVMVLFGAPLENQPGSSGPVHTPQLLIRMAQHLSHPE